MSIHSNRIKCLSHFNLVYKDFIFSLTGGPIIVIGSSCVTFSLLLIAWRSNDSDWVYWWSKCNCWQTYQRSKYTYWQWSNYDWWQYMPSNFIYWQFLCHFQPLVCMLVGFKVGRNLINHFFNVIWILKESIAILVLFIVNRQCHFLTILTLK